MPVKKIPKEKVEIDFDKVYEEIREDEEIKLSNIMKELDINPRETYEELLKPAYYHSRYYEYLEWLRKQGKTMWDFR